MKKKNFFDDHVIRDAVKAHGVETHKEFERLFDAELKRLYDDQVVEETDLEVSELDNEAVKLYEKCEKFNVTLVERDKNNF